MSSSGTDRLLLRAAQNIFSTLRTRRRWRRLLIWALYHQCAPREDFRVQLFERFHDEGQPEFIVVLAVFELGVNAADQDLVTHDEMGLHGDQGFAQLILRPDPSGKRARGTDD
jgi:hypothetical protein